MKKTAIALCLTGIVCAGVFLAVLKFKEGEINYRNSDATWHILLTLEAYDATPVSQHKYLPIVTLGRDADKFIPWGATIPDPKGNYYYTSFSPAGYFLPYCFLKAFRMPFNERTLYIFNSLLFCISALVWFAVLCKLFQKSAHQIFLAAMGTLLYLCSPELLHGMGVVYWHQSLMQVTLPLQFLCYYIWKKENRTWSSFLFGAFTLINPYVEWTGYVANFGYFLAEIYYALKNDRKRAIKNAFSIALLTLGSFVLFSIHYLSVVSFSQFFSALQSRFFARNITTSIPFVGVRYLKGLLDSFHFAVFLFALLLVLYLVSAIHRRRPGKDNQQDGNPLDGGNPESKKQSPRSVPGTAMVVFLLIFPCLENLIMKQHALQYTYDRMKLIFVLSFLICYFFDRYIFTVTSLKKQRIACVLFFFAVILTCCGNTFYYLKNTSFIWDIDYRQKNEMIAQFIKAKKIKNCRYSANYAVRGYLTLLFDRGIYEFNTGQEGNGTVVQLLITPKGWNLDRIDGINLYDAAAKTVTNITFDEKNNLKETEVSVQRH